MKRLCKMIYYIIILLLLYTSQVQIERGVGWVEGMAVMMESLGCGWQWFSA